MIRHVFLYYLSNKDNGHVCFAYLYSDSAWSSKFLYVKKFQDRRMCKMKTDKMNEKLHFCILIMKHHLQVNKQ